jgi:hypothetical protein
MTPFMRSLSAVGDTPTAAVRSLASTLRSSVAPGAASAKDLESTT